MLNLKKHKKCSTLPSQNCALYILVIFNTKGAGHLELLSTKANLKPLVLTRGCTFERLKKSLRDCDVIGLGYDLGVGRFTSCPSNSKVQSRLSNTAVNKLSFYSCNHLMQSRIF